MTDTTDHPATPLPVLVVEDDPDTLDSLGMMLEDAGYEAHLALSAHEALAAIDERVFAFVMTDLLANSGRHLLDIARTIRERAYPTPVGVLSGWNLTETQIANEGFAFVSGKPFDIDELLTSIAKALQIPPSQAQSRAMPLVHAYFAALSANDWDRLASLCAEDVAYAVPGSGPFTTTINGRAAFRAFAEQTFREFPDVNFDQIEVYSTPQGLAARYHSSWTGPDLARCDQAGSVVFQCDDAHIKRIGVSLNQERLRALLNRSTSERLRELYGR